VSTEVIPLVFEMWLQSERHVGLSCAYITSWSVKCRVAEGYSSGNYSYHFKASVLSTIIHSYIPVSTEILVLCLSDPDEDRNIPSYRLWVEEFKTRWEWCSCVDQDSFTKDGATGGSFSLGFVQR